MAITRRAFGLAGAGAIASLPFLGRTNRANAAEITWKLGIQSPISHPLVVRAQEAAARIGEETSGRLLINVFPGGQLGADMDMLSQLRSGALEMMSLSPVVLANLVPDVAACSLGYSLLDYDQVWGVMDGSFGTVLRKKAEQFRIVCLEKPFDNGFRHVTTSDKPINTPDDLRGVKIRTPVSAMTISLFEALGSAPTAISFSELYSALQTKIVDGQENPISLIQSAKLFEVQKYCSLTSHSWDGMWIGMSARAWAQLPADLQEVVVRHFNQSALDQRQDILAQNASNKEALAASGMVFNSPDLEPFRATLRSSGFYEAWKAKIDPEVWASLEEVAGKLA